MDVLVSAVEEGRRVCGRQWAAVHGPILESEVTGGLVWQAVILDGSGDGNGKGRGDGRGDGRRDGRRERRWEGR